MIYDYCSYETMSYKVTLGRIDENLVVITRNERGELYILRKGEHALFISVGNFLKDVGGVLIDELDEETRIDLYIFYEMWNDHRQAA